MLRYLTCRHFQIGVWITVLTLVPLVENATGQSIEWVRQYGTPTWDEARGVATDGMGGIYISGHTIGALGGGTTSGFDPFLTKFDQSGNLLWERRIPTSGDESHISVASDGAGQIYISGSTRGNLGGTNAGESDAFLTQFDASGNLMWSRQSGTIEFDHAYGVWADHLGHVYIAGATRGDLGGINAGPDQSQAKYDAVVSKFNEQGDLLWTRQFGDAGNDLIFGISGDSFGNIFVAGETRGNLDGTNGGIVDAFVSRFDGNGNQVWIRQFTTDHGTSAQAVASDALGNVYLSGWTGGDLEGESAGKEDIFLSKFDINGNQIWDRQFGTDQTDWGQGVVTDESGNVYVTGYAKNVLGGEYAGSTDAIISKFDASGNQYWIRQLGTSARDWPFGVATDGAGSVYFTGLTSGALAGPATVIDAFLVKIDDSLAGDYNGDGAVNAADYTVWRNGLATRTYADFAYQVWRSNFGQNELGDFAVNVPEPTGWYLLLVGVLGFLSRYRDRDK